MQLKSYTQRLPSFDPNHPVVIGPLLFRLYQNRFRIEVGILLGDNLLATRNHQF